MTNLKLETELSPNDTLAKYFPEGAPWMVSGGWGYSKDDAIIINKLHHARDSVLPFDPVGLEYVLIAKRLELELVHLCEQGERSSRHEYKLKKQKNYEGGFDQLTVEVSRMKDVDFEKMREEWSGPNGSRSPNFDIKKHDEKFQSLVHRYQQIHWFHIIRA